MKYAIVLLFFAASVSAFYSNARIPQIDVECITSDDCNILCARCSSSGTIVDAEYCIRNRCFCHPADLTISQWGIQPRNGAPRRPPPRG